VVGGRAMSLMAWTLIGDHPEVSNTPILAVVPDAKRQKAAELPQVPLATALLAGAKKMSTAGKYFKNCTCMNMVERCLTFNRTRILLVSNCSVAFTSLFLSWHLVACWDERRVRGENLGCSE